MDLCCVLKAVLVYCLIESEYCRTLLMPFCFVYKSFITFYMCMHDKLLFYDIRLVHRVCQIRAPWVITEIRKGVERQGIQELELRV